jgi:hypothetical protein
LTSISLLHGEKLEDLDNEDFRSELSGTIFSNTLRPLRIDSSLSPRDYTSLFIGHNLRWEILGIIFTLTGVSALNLPARSPLLAETKARFNSKADFAYQMINASNRCLGFCDQFGNVNNLLVWLMYKNLLLLTMVHGDSSMQEFMFFLDALLAHIS